MTISNSQSILIKTHLITSRNTGLIDTPDNRSSSAVELRQVNESVIPLIATARQLKSIIQDTISIQLNSHTRRP